MIIYGIDDEDRGAWRARCKLDRLPAHPVLRRAEVLEVLERLHPPGRKLILSRRRFAAHPPAHRADPGRGQLAMT